MPADDQRKQRFEPPPWEREAFDRFERERAERKAREELDEELSAVRSAPGSHVEAPTPREHPVGLDPAVALGSQASPVEAGAAVSLERPSVAPVPDAKVEAMLVQLRMEEPKVAGMSMGLIYGIITTLSLTGVFIIVQAALLFARARSSDAAGTMLAATMSFVVLFAGVGFITGAVLLFRKYHR